MTTRYSMRSERADDIARLKAELQLPALKYIDVSVQRALRRALQRWPLLAEFEQAQPLPSVQAAPAQPDEAQVSA
ncbi:YhjR family protein [Pseudomonas sp. B21-056]|uniref:cellulose biosynthesis protein BcsR n=1 Tax=Pseudomonas sp. B21-056 TaxID=2895495 RepID=UPI0022312817|nr:cellulose biosynthesis protein BcsR [Pseudomonas sp. B21-056]UZE21531.1 YhjR family protein [Pseudomonas sp. B21-056]